ncbi:MAG: protein kinase [Planctomycetes bacterium]|nr:protein kinase [Planctomycetota bacterium]
MSIRCPYCRFNLVIKGAKPGRFTPKCTSCDKRFLLTVTDDAEPKFITAVIASEVDAEETAPPQRAEPSAASATQPPAATQAVTAPSARAGRSHHAPSASTPAAPDEKALPENLGGYVVSKRIGKGGMGSVYLARQVSLDRDVAVKVMNPQWATDPEFVARFTREAYAAAQLVHHNVVQIHDIGAEQDLHYFSMEFVDGASLAQVVKEQGKLDPEVAVGYALQAARALKFAHDHGMVHRDIKPENLLINSQGIVKVADLGLVKISRRGGDTQPAVSASVVSGGDATQTQINTSMGTPAYMAPEQAENATHADHRADIYSLGCTLYDLVTGRPPFEGKSVVEVMTKHASENVTPPERLAARVSPVLSQIIVKMMAKRPDDRYADMGQVIKALEGFLGIDSTGPFSPREEHANALETAVAQFNASPRAKLRRTVVLAFLAGCVLLTALSAWYLSVLLAAGILGMMVLTIAAYVAVTGITHKTYLFRKVRQATLGAGVGDWIVRGLGLIVIVAVIFMVAPHLLWIWLLSCAAAVGLALAFYMFLDRSAMKERQPSIDSVNVMLRSMRLKGLEEDSLRQFVCKYSGKTWEEFYEALFGYEAKIEARERWGKGEQGKPRKKHGSWRDPIIRGIEARQKARQAKRETRLLQKLEEKELKAKGVEAAAAKRQASARAEAMVENAAAFKDEVSARNSETLAPGAAPARPMASVARMTQLDDAALVRQKARRGAVSNGTLKLICGSGTRFILGALLVAAFAAWVQHEGVMAGSRMNIGDPKTAVVISDGLSLFTRGWLNSPAMGVAGLFLILSVFWRSWKVGAVILFAAAVMLFGPLLGVPTLFAGSPIFTCIGIGSLIAIVTLGVTRT